MKLIFVASDFSGLGKGTFAASLGRVLLSCGKYTRIMKNDLYFNYDAGTINPGEHGEVYVLKDGTEVDQDFGIYERFLNIEHSSVDYMTSGRLFYEVYLKERAGDYLGQTVSAEHVIELLKKKIIDFSNSTDIGIVELGATVGDIKGSYLMEAVRQIINEIGPKNSTFILLSYFPFLENVGELKTMGCQRSVSILRSKGIKPDIIIARSSNCKELPSYQMSKLELYCEVPEGAVFCFPDLKDYYQIPRRIKLTNVHKYIAKKMMLDLVNDDLDKWYELTFDNLIPYKIALLGKYPHKDAYISIVNQLRMFGITSVEFEDGPNNLENYDGVIVPGGWGERGVEKIIQGIQVCRENKIPCLGICLGLQLMFVEYARNVLNLKDANSLEFSENTMYPVVTLQEEQKKRCGLGGTSRLGNWITQLDKESKLGKVFEDNVIVQRHRHRYEINSQYVDDNFKIVGRDRGTDLVEVMELKNHPYFVGVQFHPEFYIGKSPVFKSFIDNIKIKS